MLPAVLAPPGAPHLWRGSRQRDALKSGRTRYDHLVGPLRLHGLKLARPTGGSSAPPKGDSLTPAGCEWLAGLQVEGGPAP